MIYFIRHGVTDWNDYVNERGEKDPKLQGWADIPLNEKGIEQAKAAAKTLEGVKFDRVFCSPLQRARQTLEQIHIDGAKVVFDDRLKERNFGEFEGKCKSVMDFGEFWDVRLNKKYEKAESVVDFQNRVFGFLDELKQFKDDNILIVAHGGIGSSIKRYFYGYSADGNLLGPVIENAKAITFDFKDLNR